jgi:cell pole-organizing protein PopZ
MSDPRPTSGDPSMDDILASIRKIISEDEARAQLARAQAGGTSQPAADQDVLLLTELIEEPRSEDAAPATPPAGAPGRTPNMAEPPMAEPSGPSSNESSLVAAAVAGAASSAFARLNQAVQESVPLPAAGEPGPAVSANGKTIEDLVKEMLRPMLKDWLDRNLPAIVERYVEREVVRLTRR